MSYAQDNGYTPADFATIISDIREGINTQFSTAYTEENFVGTSWYKYAYAIAQKIQSGEIKTSEVFQKLQEYIAETNDSIQRPSVSNPGLLETFDSEGYIASVKPMIEADAGKIHVCVDLDDSDPDYDDTKLAICQLLSTCIVGGVVSMGTEVEAIVLSNGQSFDYKFYLPDRIPVLLRLTAVESENNQLLVPDDETIRQAIFDNINARYRLGKNFEPQRYYSAVDAPWAASLVLEWSDDAGMTWYAVVFDADFDEIFDFDLEDIQVLVS